MFIQIFRGPYKNFSILCIKCSWQFMLEKSRTSRSTLFSFDWILELSKRLKKRLCQCWLVTEFDNTFATQQELFLEGQAQEGLTKNGCSQLSMMVYLYIVLEGEISALCLCTIDIYASRLHACSFEASNALLDAHWKVGLRGFWIIESGPFSDSFTMRENSESIAVIHIHIVSCIYCSILYPLWRKVEQKQLGAGLKMKRCTSRIYRIFLN